jgi:ElaB/YqjD/DUF883 family membrane-anchored ribosome-binding protein
MTEAASQARDHLLDDMKAVIAPGRSTAMPDVTNATAREQLVADMKAVIADAEALLKATAGEVGERIGAARSRAEESLKAAKARISTLDDAAIDRAKEAAKAADDFARQHPWSAIGIAAAAGLVVGVLIARR